jgi:hypothetical protein
MVLSTAAIGHTSTTHYPKMYAPMHVCTYRHSLPALVGEDVGVIGEACGMVGPQVVVVGGHPGLSGATPVPRPLTEAPEDVTDGCVYL